MDWSQIVLALIAAGGGIVGAVNIAAIIRARAEARKTDLQAEAAIEERLWERAKSELEGQYATIDQLKAHVGKLERNMNRAIEERDGKIAGQQKEIDDLKRQLAELKRLLNARDRRIQELENSEAEQAHRLRLLRDERDGLSAEKAQWARDRAKWEREKAQLEARVTELETEVRQLKEKQNGGT